MRAWAWLVALAALAALARRADSKPLEPLELCPPSCRCFYSEGLRRADCKHVPEWADHVYDAQDVRIIPPPAGRGSRSSVLHLTHFDVFPKALQLAITNRSVVEIIPGGFHGMHSLQDLDLSNNLLSHFNEKVFRRMPALRRLVLQGNPIILEPNTPLLTSSSLRSLDLSFCDLVDIPKGSLDGVRNLTSLSLRGNLINLDSPRPLLPITTLLELDLSACELEVIPAKSLDNLVNLRRLYLDGNNLKTVERGVLPRGLHVLDLSSNQIRDAPTAVISSFKNLSKLEMSDNPMKCTCTLIGLQDWMSRRLVVSEKPVVCAEPEKYKGMPWTKVNDLELCRAEAAAAADEYSSSDSDTSEDSNTKEDDDSSQSSSIELPSQPPASYEIYTNEENIIKHRQPAIQLDGLLEKKALYLQSNNEENSIQSDQPYASATHTDYPLEDEPLHEHVVEDRAAEEEEVTAKPTDSPEDQEDKEADEEQSEENDDPNQDEENETGEDSNVETETDAPEVGLEAQDLLKADDGTESDGTENPNAEVFMKNQDTIAMGKSMPNGDSEEETEIPPTPTVTTEVSTITEAVDEDTQSEDAESDSRDANDDIHPEETSENENENTNDDESKDELEAVTNETLPTESIPTVAPPSPDLAQPSEDTIITGEGEKGNSSMETVASESESTEKQEAIPTTANVREDPTEDTTTQSSETSTEPTSTTVEIMPIPEGGDRSAYGKSMETGSNENQDSGTPLDTLTEAPPSIVPASVNHQDHEEVSGDHLPDITEAPVPIVPETTVYTHVEEPNAHMEDIISENREPEEEVVRGIEASEEKQPSKEAGTVHPPASVPTQLDADMPVVEEEIQKEVAKNIVENFPAPAGGGEAAEEKPEASTTQTIKIDDEAELVTEGHNVPSGGIPNYTVDKGDSATDEGPTGDLGATVLAGDVNAGLGQSQELAIDNVDVVPNGGVEEIQKSTITYIILGCIVIAIVVLIVYALLRGKADKKDGKTPVRIRRDDEDPGTEMKDMMNPLLEPAVDQPAANEFQDEPRRVSLVSLELIREVEEDNLTEGKSSVEDGEAADPPKAMKGSPGAKTADNLTSSSQTPDNRDGKIADVVIETPPSAVRKQPNGQPVANGKSPAPPKHNGTPTVASKVKVVAGVIPAPIPRTPVLINRINGVSTVNGANGMNGLNNTS